jgi:O-antigen ligase
MSADNMSANTRAPVIFFLPFVITFLDSAFAYFANPAGLHVTANAAVPFILLYFFCFDSRSVSLPRGTFIWLCILVASLCLAILTARDMSPHRILEAGSCAAAFFSGYLLCRRAADENQLARWMIALSLVYVVICVIALRGLNPAHFPVNNFYWSQDGLAQARPMVTADSNMQIYYLFPAALVLALPFRLVRMAITAVAVLGGLYVLAQLQTRSGTLAYCGMMALALSAPLWNKELGRTKMLLYPLVGAAGIVVFWPVISQVAGLLLYRFTEDDMASGNGRLGSMLYAFQHLLDPYWWVPRGADEFLQRYGGLPHSNLTAIFLDGGLPGLIAWGALVVVPVGQAAALLLKRKLDAASIMIFIAVAAQPDARSSLAMGRCARWRADTHQDAGGRPACRSAPCNAGRIPCVAHRPRRDHQRPSPSRSLNEPAGA